MYHKNVSHKPIGVIFSQNYLQELSKSLIKKPTCFQAGFSTSSSKLFIA